ncbi:long-chain fatty acid-CoA ligase [Phlyctochytrium planicorne]|nr:long-chain fatty acid-CoA ligase [Phlyctochytrium planicorne]
MILTVLAWILIAILLPITLFRFRLGRPRAVRVGSEGPDRGQPRRNIKYPNTLLTKPASDVNTLYDAMLRSFKLMPHKKTFGARKIVKIVEEEKEVTKVIGGVETTEKKTWKYMELSPYSWLTYAEIKDLAFNAGAGFRQLGLNPGDKVTLFASTSRDWMIVAMSCFTQNLTITTAYDTLGEEGLSFSLNEGEVTTLFTNADLLPITSKIIPIVPTLKNVIFNGETPVTTLENLRTKHPHVRFMPLDALQQLGADHPVDPVPPKPEDLACIMYTSGSTGNPKGVMLTHANIVASIAGARTNLLGHINDNETYLAFLPLAHILELMVEMTLFYEGVAIGYGAVRTLTDASVRNCLGDIRELRPTIMAGVPAVWESIRKGVMSKIREAKPMQQRIFNIVFELKWLFIQLGLPTGIFDKIVFDKIKHQTGGRLKFAVSGGAPIPKSTQKFLTVCIAPLVSGYGMTECVAVLTMQNLDQYSSLGVVGPPVAAAEVMLVDVADTNYSSKNRPRPQGEVWIRGPTVMKGYYKQPELTKEALTEDGWLMTGDIGEWQPDGNLSIIDRKKNLLKTANGEYIAVEKLESVYKTSKFVQNICVYADSEQFFAIAVVQPIEKELSNYLKSKNVNTANLDLEGLAKHPEAAKGILFDLREVAKSVGLKPIEIVGGVFVAGEEWTPQNGLLTAAMKLKRKEIVVKYKDDINKLYSPQK